MHFLSIQVQPNLLVAFNERAIDQLRSLEAPEGSVQDVQVQHGNDDGPYFNITFATPDPKVLWPSVRKELVRLGLQSASIATCTGSRGWDNYLLLHHFSREIPKERFGAP
jgi:hypothetical protein